MSEQEPTDSQGSRQRDRKLIQDARRQVQAVQQRDDETATADERTAAEPAMPREVGSVRLIREIGRGGMGVVYLGRDRMLDRDVAVKFMLKAVTGPDDPGFSRLMKEGKAAAAVRHPRLTTVYNAGLVDGIPYLVMEYVDGPTLSEVVKGTGSLGIDATCAALEGVCTALGELHDRGIVHRDIKPSNVLLDAEGGVYVTDFGLVCNRVPMGSTRFPAGLAGTPAYMAPEMFEGSVSTRSDVYALGVTLFQLLTSAVPYRGTVDEIADQHQYAELPLDPLREAHVDAAIVEVLQRATHKNPMFRYKSARHFLRALQEAHPNPKAAAAGTKELAERVARCRNTPTSEPRPHTGSSTSSSYFERLTALADTKREKRSRSAGEPGDTGEVLEDVAPSRKSRIMCDVRCVDCGYNLRTLRAGANCPECNTPLSSSLDPGRLIFADPRWLSRVAFGTTIIMVAAMGLFLWAFVYLALGGRLSIDDKLAVGSVITSAWYIVGFVGVLLLTARERRPIVSRRVAVLRWAALISTGLLVPTEVMTVVSRLRVFEEWDLATLELNLDTIIALPCVLLYMRALAARVPDASLERRLRNVVVFIAAVMLAFPVVVTLFSFGGEFTIVWFAVLLDLTALAMLSFRRAIKSEVTKCVAFDSLFVDAKSVVPADVEASQSASRQAIRLAAHQVTEEPLQVDVDCAQCGYNLKSLSAGANCPECNSKVSSSLDPDRLMFADPKWLSKIALGLTILFVTAVGFVPAQLARMILVENQRFGIGTMVLLSVGTPLLWCILGLVTSVYFITAREPRPTLVERSDPSRRVARLLAFLLIPTVIIAYPFSMMAAEAINAIGSFGSVNQAQTDGMLWRAILGVTVLALASVIGISLYMRKLANRIPDVLLARASWFLIPLLLAVVTLLVVTATPFMYPVFGAAYSRLVRTSLQTLVMVLTPGAIILIPLFVFRFRRVIKRTMGACVPYDSLFGNGTAAVVASVEAPTVAGQSQTRATTRGTTENVLKADVDCAQCGYNLRSQSARANCPECNAAVSSSLNPDRLMFADLRWLSKIALGHAVIFATMVGVYPNYILVRLLANRSLISDVYELTMFLGWPALGFATGILLITAREPQHWPVTLKASPLVAQITATIPLVMVVVVVVAHATGAMSESDFYDVLNRYVAFGRWPIAWLVILSAWLITAVSVAVYMQALASRIPDAHLARISRRFLVLIAAIAITLPVSFGLFQMHEILGPLGPLWTVIAIGTFLWIHVFTYGSYRIMKQVIADHVSYDALFSEQAKPKSE